MGGGIAISISVHTLRPDAVFLVVCHISLIDQIGRDNCQFIGLVASGKHFWLNNTRAEFHNEQRCLLRRVEPIPAPNVFA